VKNYKPAAISFHEDAGSEVWTTTNLTIFGSSLSLLGAIHPSNVAFDLNRRIVHHRLRIACNLSNAIAAADA
jgi:hypothetical protein